jgi:hypothetical protein
MSITRVGLSETSQYAAGWDAVFGKKSVARTSAASKPARKTAARKKPKKKPSR